MTTTRNAVKSERDVERDIMNRLEVPETPSPSVSITTKTEEPKMKRPKENIMAL